MTRVSYGSHEDRPCKLLRQSLVAAPFGASQIRSLWTTRPRIAGHGGTTEKRKPSAPRAFWTSDAPRCGGNSSRIGRRPLELWLMQQSCGETLPPFPWQPPDVRARELAVVAVAEHAGRVLLGLQWYCDTAEDHVRHRDLQPKGTERPRVAGEGRHHRGKESYH